NRPCRAPSAYRRPHPCRRRRSFSRLPAEAKTFVADILETIGSAGEHCLLTGVILPAPHNGVAVERVVFDEAGRATGLLGRDERTPRAAEPVQHDLPALRTVADCVRDKRDRLDRGVHRELVRTVSTNRADTGIVPHVGTIAARLTEPEGVGVG